MVPLEWTYCCKYLRNENEDDKNEEGGCQHYLGAKINTLSELVIFFIGGIFNNF